MPAPLPPPLLLSQLVVRILADHIEARRLLDHERRAHVLLALRTQSPPVVALLPLLALLVVILVVFVLLLGTLLPVLQAGQGGAGRTGGDEEVSCCESASP